MTGIIAILQTSSSTSTVSKPFVPNRAPRAATSDASIMGTTLGVAMGGTVPPLLSIAGVQAQKLVTSRWADGSAKTFMAVAPVSEDVSCVG